MLCASFLTCCVSRALLDIHRTQSCLQRLKSKPQTALPHVSQLSLVNKTCKWTNKDVNVHQPSSPLREISSCAKRDRPRAAFVYSQSSRAGLVYLCLNLLILRWLQGKTQQCCSCSHMVAWEAGIAAAELSKTWQSTYTRCNFLKGSQGEQIWVNFLKDHAGDIPGEKATIATKFNFPFISRAVQGILFLTTYVDMVFNRRRITLFCLQRATFIYKFWKF